MSRRWQRVLAVVAVCLPVPLAGATGLSIPLPSTVERLAAMLVPWAEAASLDGNEALAPGAGGSITLVSGEGRPVFDAAERDALRGLAAAHAGERAEKYGAAEETRDEDPADSKPGTSDPRTSDPGTSDPGTSDPGTSDPGAETGDDSGLVEDTAGQVGETVDPVLDAGDDVVDVVGGAVGDAEDSVGGLVGGLE